MQIIRLMWFVVLAIAVAASSGCGGSKAKIGKLDRNAVVLAFGDSLSLFFRPLRQAISKETLECRLATGWHHSGVNYLAQMAFDHIDQIVVVGINAYR